MPKVQAKLSHQGIFQNVVDASGTTFVEVDAYIKSCNAFGLEF